MSKKQSHYIRTDLIFILLLFISVSLLAIYNAQQLEQYASENFVLKQAAWFLISIGILAVIEFLDLERWYKSRISVYWFGVLILIILCLSPAGIAKVINGSKSWFAGLPVVSLQPSEFT